MILDDLNSNTEFGKISHCHMQCTLNWIHRPYWQDTSEHSVETSWSQLPVGPRGNGQTTESE